MTDTGPVQETRVNCSAIVNHLAAAGLNLYACLSVASLAEEQISGLDDVAAEGQSLLLIGNAGPAFWTACQSSDLRFHTDPVDQFSQRTVTQALQRFAPETEYKLLYPATNCMIPLQKLGAAAGWHQPSPLGIGMHPDAGLWFAYRALVLVDADWSATAISANVADKTDYCAQCETQECLTACPAQALAMDQVPDLQRCCDFRLLAGSACEAQCLARLACPLFPEQRYSQDQIRHHYMASLDSLRRFIQRAPGDV